MKKPKRQATDFWPLCHKIATAPFEIERARTAAI